MKTIIFRMPNGNLYCKSNFEHDFVINGNVVHCSHFTVDKIDSLQIRHYNYTLVHYQDNEGEILSNSEYRNRIEELISKGDYNEDTEEYDFEDVEDQVAYLRFKRKWVPVHNPQYKFEAVQYEIQELPAGSAKYPEIKVSWRHEVEISPMCFVNVNYFARKEIEQAKIKYDKYIEPRKSTGCGENNSLRYTKINDNYISDFEIYDNNPVFRGLMSECEDKLDKVKIHIDDVFRRELNKRIVPADYGQIIGELKGILQGVKNLEVMKKSNIQHSALIVSIRSYIEHYEKFCIESDI